jgi:hypothetical protein
MGYAAILNGSLGLSISETQQRQLLALIAERTPLLRYQASLVGLATYVNSLRRASGYTGSSFLGQVMADPRSQARAVMSTTVRVAPWHPTRQQATSHDVS